MNMDDLIKPIISLIPEKYRATVGLIIAVSPYVTRTVYALMNGRGLRGVLSAIWLGTNTPTKTETPKTS